MRVLLTGGAGFIGSHLADAFMKHPEITKVRVLDNLSTGSLDNLSQHLDHPKFEWWEGDIRNYDTCMAATESMDVVSHQAALGSVPRSIDDPLTTHAVNATGTLHLLQAARTNGIRRFVYAASSSTYGDNTDLPKIEAIVGRPLSPYAVTKLVNELYAGVFARQFGLNTIGLRYFNVFGPRQRPEGPYAAAIPRFIDKLLRQEPPVIFGDGSTSRDFTYVDNVVQANLLAMFQPSGLLCGEVFNIACGQQTSLLTLIHILKRILQSDIIPVWGPARQGDVMHSLADIDKARISLGYTPRILVEEGLKKTVTWTLAQQNIPA